VLISFPRTRCAELVSATVMLMALSSCDWSSVSDKGSGSPNRDATTLSISMDQLSSLPIMPVDTIPTVVIGSGTGSDTIPLHRVRAAVSTVEGGIILADQEGTLLRKFDASGTYLGAFGREGDGPAEYRRMDGLILSEDSLAVFDRLRGRITILGPALNYVRSIPLDRTVQLNGTFGNLTTRLIQSLGVATAVTLASSPLTLETPRERGLRITEEAFTLLRIDFSSDTAVIDTLITSLRGAVVATEPDGYKSKVRFGSVPFLAANAAGVAYTQGSAPEVSLYEADGKTRVTVRIEVARRPVTATDRASAEQVQIGRGGPAHFADEHPAVHGLEMDSAGRVWLLLDSLVTGRRGWLILRHDGEPLGWRRTLVPHYGVVMHFGRDHLLARRTDQLGVERIEKYSVNIPD
jgi:hypothetical protein